MKTRAGLFSIAALLITGVAVSGEIVVHLDDVPNSKGTLIATLVNSDDAWNFKAPPVQEKRVHAMKGNMELKFENVTPGIYAISIHHDANDNGKFDTNVIGIPTEGYGYSNNAHPMRRARFDEARFEVKAENLALEIILR
jgi:uncharacterized protein (DUF2141 family)